MGTAQSAIIWLLCGIAFGAWIVVIIWHDHRNTFKDHTQEEYKNIWSKFYTLWMSSPAGKGNYKTVTVNGKSFNFRAEYSKLKCCDRVVFVDFLIDETVVATSIKMTPEVCHCYYDFEIQKPYIKEEILKIIDEAFSLVLKSPKREELEPKSVFGSN